MYSNPKCALALILSLCLSSPFGALLAQDNRSAVPEVPDALDLQTALEFALEHNFEIQQALESIREQEGLIVEVKAQALPSLSLNANYRRLDENLSESDSFFPAREDDWAITLAARQTLYQGGGVRAALDAQSLLRESALLSLETTILDALLDVRTLYYTALLYRDQIGVEEQNIELLQQSLESAQLRREAGEVSDFEVLRAEVLLANAQPDLIRRQGDFRVTIEQLRRAMGYQNYRRDASNLNKLPELTDTLEYRPMDYELAQALDAALSQRSEIRQIEAVREAREAGLKVANSGRLPKLDLVGTYGKQRSSFSKEFDDGPEGWTVGVEASWNIWEGNRVRGQRLQALSQIEQSRIEEENLRLSIEIQVRQAISNLQEADQLVKSATRVVEQAEESMRMADNRFAAGSISQLDVLEAQVALTQARTNELAANFQHLVAKAQFRRALGAENISREKWPDADEPRPERDEE